MKQCILDGHFINCLNYRGLNMYDEMPEIVKSGGRMDMIYKGYV